MWESKNQKLLKFIIDRQLNFDGYLKSLCKLAGTSLGSSARLANFLSSEKKKQIMKSFIVSQPLHRHLYTSREITEENSPLHIAGSRTRSKREPLVSQRKFLTTKLRINHIHEEALIIIYRNNSLCFDELIIV